MVKCKSAQKPTEIKNYLGSHWESSPTLAVGTLTTELRLQPSTLSLSISNKLHQPIMMGKAGVTTCVNQDPYIFTMYMYTN